MNLYQIDRRIEELLQGSVNEETGELIINEEELFALQMDHETKLEHCAAAYKEYLAEAEGVKSEIKRLQARVETLERRAASAQKVIETYLEPEEEIKSERVYIHRSTRPSVKVDKAFKEWAIQNNKIYLNRSETYTPDKTKMKEILLTGAKIPYATLEYKLKID